MNNTIEPKQYFVKLPTEEQRVGRIIVHFHNPSHYSAEVDIVFKETQKIDIHVAWSSGHQDFDMALFFGRQKLINFLKTK